MKKVLSVILVFALCLCMSACGFGKPAAAPEPTQTPIEEIYAQLVELAKSGQYLEAWRLCKGNLAVLKHNDGQAYYDYCEAMRAYEAGGIGFAYNKLKEVPDILNAKSTIAEIEARIGGLDGYYVTDNGMGSYLHIVIRDGLAACEVIGYQDEPQTFDYNAEDVYWNELVASEYTDGREFIAIGRYSSIGAEVKIDYAIETFDDTTDIMVVKFEGAEYSTMNGLYSKVEEVE